MNGLIVLQPYADRIISGKKRFEYRKKQPPQDKINVSIFLLSKGFALGKIKIDCIVKNVNTGFYGWDITVLEKFDRPKKYFHPNGAQVWVKKVLLK